MPSNNDPSNKQKQGGSGSDRGFAAMDEEKRREPPVGAGKLLMKKGVPLPRLSTPNQVLKVAEI